MSRLKVGDPVEDLVSPTYKESVGMDGGPFCYLCGRYINRRANAHTARWVAVGPGQERRVFARADEPDVDSVRVGSSCLRRVPLESIFPPGLSL